VLLTALMIAFGFLRSEQSAWWNVLAWTLRNGATLAPVLAALLWPLATRHSVVAAMAGGFLAGMSWYHLSGWSTGDFYLDIHPVWAGMMTNLVVMVTVTLLETRHHVALVPATDPRRYRGFGLLGVAAVALAVLALYWSELQAYGLVGLLGFGTVVSI